MVNVPLVQPDDPAGKLNVPLAEVPRYARVPVAVTVPLDDPDIKAIVRFKLELDCIAGETWPLTLNVVPVAVINGKQEFAGLLTAVTVPIRVEPFWLKLIVNPVLGGIVPCDAFAASVSVHLPVTDGVRFEEELDIDE